MNDTVEELKDKAEEFLDRNKDGKINAEDFHALEKKEKAVFIVVSALAVIVVATLVADLVGAISGAKEKKPKPAEEPATVEETVPEIQQVSLTDDTVAKIAEGVAARVQGADPETVADNVSRIEALESSVGALREDVERVRKDIATLNSYADELLREPPKKKRKKFLGIF